MLFYSNDINGMVSVPDTPCHQSRYAKTTSRQNKTQQRCSTELMNVRGSS